MSDQIDLYAVLGLKRAEQPTRAEIRKTYRRLAKTAHPDVGGDPAVFERITLAHDVLTDTARKARYDATGEFDGGGADNGHVEMYVNLGQLLDEVAQEIVKREIDIDTVDYPHEMRVRLRQQIKYLGTAQRKINSDLPKLRRAAKRFRKRSGGNDPLSAIFAARILKLEEFAASLAKSETISKDMLEFLKDYDFDLSDLQRAAQPATALRLASPSFFPFRTTTT